MVLAMAGSLWFANESNAGKFWDRLPHLFDFIGQLLPRDGWEVWRAMFDLPSPYDDGSLKYNYPEGRMYLTETLYVPEYVYKMLETLNIALVSTLIGFAAGLLPLLPRGVERRRRSAGCASSCAASWKCCAPSRRS